jgi:hypothetical protein
MHQYLVFVGWSSDTRKLGIKHYYNRPCALYAVKAPFYESEANELELKWVNWFCKIIFFFSFSFFHWLRPSLCELLHVGDGVF